MISVRWFPSLFYFLFETIDIQEFVKAVQRGPVFPLTKFFPLVISYITKMLYQNQEMDIGTICVYSSMPFYFM